MPSYKSYNKVTLIGNLTNDIELKYLSTGTAVGNSRIALNESYTDKVTGEEIDNSSFIDLQFWGKQAEVVAQYLGKGDRIFIDGSLKSQRWETEDGQKRSRILVKVYRFMFMSNNKSNQNRINQQQNPINIDSNEELPEELGQMEMFFDE